jgi:hypothetical protein
MRAAVHATITFVEWQTAYHPDTKLHPRCSVALYRQCVGPTLRMPTTVPQLLMSLKPDARPMSGGSDPLHEKSAPTLLVSDEEDHVDLDDVCRDPV